MIIILSFVFSGHYREKEKSLELNFTIDSISCSSANRLIFYNKKKQSLDLNSYVFYDNEDIIKGDVIVKRKNERTLKVYRNHKLILTKVN